MWHSFIRESFWNGLSENLGLRNSKFSSLFKQWLYFEQHATENRPNKKKLSELQTYSWTWAEQYVLWVRSFCRWDLILKLPSLRSVLYGIIWYWLLMSCDVVFHSSLGFSDTLLLKFDRVCVPWATENKSNSETKLFYLFQIHMQTRVCFLLSLPDAMSKQTRET